MIAKGSTGRALFLFIGLLWTVNTIVKLIPQFICTGNGVRSELCRHVYSKAFLSLFVTRFWAILFNSRLWKKSPRSTWCRKHYSRTIWSRVQTICSFYLSRHGKTVHAVDQKTLPPSWNSFIVHASAMCVCRLYSELCAFKSWVAHFSTSPRSKTHSIDRKTLERPLERGGARTHAKYISRFEHMSGFSSQVNKR